VGSGLVAVGGVALKVAGKESIEKLFCDVRATVECGRRGDTLVDVALGDERRDVASVNMAMKVWDG